MEITRFSANAVDQSEFEIRDIPLSERRQDDFGHEILSSRPFAAEAVVVELPAGLDQDWHGAPDRQLVVVLSGRLEVEVGDGSRRQWGPGGAFLADDLSGQGHRTRALDGPVRLVFLRLGADFDLAAWPAS
jgi:quercetin dioxygenase-like cupin family protein